MKNTGLNTRTELVVFEETEHNLNNSSGYWKDTFNIKPSDFGVDKLLVKDWICGDVDEEYYLVNE